MVYKASETNKLKDKLLNVESNAGYCILIFKCDASDKFGSVNHFD